MNGNGPRRPVSNTYCHPNNDTSEQTHQEILGQLIKDLTGNQCFLEQIPLSSPDRGQTDPLGAAGASCILPDPGGPYTWRQCPGAQAFQWLVSQSNNALAWNSSFLPKVQSYPGSTSFIFGILW